MEVAVSALRAELRQWIETARTGQDVVITERGIPVARLTGIESADLLARLERDGLLAPARATREAAQPVAVDGAHGGRDGARDGSREGARQGVSSLVRRLRR
ncbi:type II toxin-antitoxin system prevent-host-death family antitoxin [Cellulomonas palmilytica]|uniref:type II toxin-antitoxin system prevent-host-death family antitoxin n=1 Tax=Cellulomonas palmilytica TaxID=2608402 RepID=UPI001F45C207|nr:type II toxin-antitoxin system prevent-host-death family antitoxin [Cellulomonas palmilytica]UJP41489.1 type II toxin-antitoxin system prevent-host-death family antitoxin [Cellulomonas palmilytica]